MTTVTKNRSDSFYPVLASVAIVGPILLVVATALLPDGTSRGEFMVSGLGFVIAMLAVTLLLRAVYSLGFTKALRVLESIHNHPVTGL